MPKNLTDFEALPKTSPTTLIPFPPGLARPDQTRDWANSLASVVAQAGLTHVANARLPPGMFEELYDEDALRDPPDLPSNPSFGDQATHRKLCDDIQRRKLHNERVIKQSESWFKTKNNEFFVIITDSMAKTRPGRGRG